MTHLPLWAACAAPCALLVAVVVGQLVAYRFPDLRPD